MTNPETDSEVDILTCPNIIVDDLGREYPIIAAIRIPDESGRLPHRHSVTCTMPGGNYATMEIAYQDDSTSDNYGRWSMYWSHYEISDRSDALLDMVQRTGAHVPQQKDRTLSGEMRADGTVKAHVNEAVDLR